VGPERTALTAEFRMEEFMFDSLAFENPKRKWATLTSFTLETAFLGMLLSAPLAFTDKLQLTSFAQTLIAPTGPPADPGRPDIQQHSTAHSVTTEFRQGHLVYTGKVPATIAMLHESQNQVMGDPANWVIGAPPGDKTNAAMQRLLRTVTPDPIPAPAPKAPIKISNLDPGFLIHRVHPIYPHSAIITRTEGTVVLAALIDTSGHITQLRAVSGHPLLIPAAIDAVRQWRYKPYMLNGSPVEVETQVSIIFTLNR
jgi:protein TonB